MELKMTDNKKDVKIGDKIYCDRWNSLGGTTFTVTSINPCGVEATQDDSGDKYAWMILWDEFSIIEDDRYTEYTEGLWYPWVGGSNPVHPLTTVNILTAKDKPKGIKHKVVNSGQCVWQWFTGDDDDLNIVAFKVVKHYVPQKDEDGRGPWIKNTTGEKPEVLSGQELDIIMGGHSYINREGNINCDYSLDHPYPVKYYRVVGLPVETKEDQVWAHGEGRKTSYNLVDGKVDWSSFKVLEPIGTENWVENTGEAPEVPEGYTLDIKFNGGHIEYATDYDWGWPVGDGDYHISHYRLNPPE